MPADLSRIRHHPLLDYAAVELKQGAVLLDADANELSAILDRRLRALASDVLGRATVSQTTPEAFALSLVAGQLRLGRGRLYVDGLLAENHGSGVAAFDPLLAEPTHSTTTALTAQPYMPAPITPPQQGRHLVYLDVWPREVTHLEQPDLVEPAVNVETSSRQQTVWQVRLLPNVGADVTCDTALPAWDALVAPSRARLTSATVDVVPITDPCELPPTGGYRGLENQLYRVEVHDPGMPGAGATFKWSRENASVGSRVLSLLSARELELETLGRDEVLGFAEGDWIELLDDHAELGQGGGTMRRISLIEPDNRRITLAEDLPADLQPAAFPDAQLATTRHLRVRRWDHGGPVFRVGSAVPIQDLDDAGSAGVINVPEAGVRVVLEHGVTVTFSTVAGAGPGLRRGDWWVFAARTADASVEELQAAPPRGTHHRYARLGFWDVTAGAVTDCRTLWPPATEGGYCSCTECVTPESHANGSLTIQAAVDRVRDTGGTVCLHAGLYPLNEPVRVAGAVSLTIRGQGPATVLTAPGTALAIEGAAGVVLEKLSVISMGAASAVTVRTVAGLRLADLVLLVLGVNDGTGAGIGLNGLCAGVAIRDNLIVAIDGIRNEGAAGQRLPVLLTAAVQVHDNVLWCRRRGLALEGAVAHLYGHQVEGNEVLGCRNGGLTALGLSLAGASMRFVGNSISVNGPGIECGVDGAWIEGNKLVGVRQGSRTARGSGIVLARGLDPNGSDQAQVLANQISGFDGAGVQVAAPVRDLICKLNIVERCGAGIVMGDEAEADAVSIENNHVRDISGGVDGADTLAVGIAVARAASAVVAGNQVQRVGLVPGTLRVFAGVLLLGTQRARVQGNVVSEIGPVADFAGIGAGIMLRAPLGDCDVAGNQVERDADPQTNAGEAVWSALWIQDGTVVGRVTGDLAAGAVMRTAGTTTVRLDNRRTLVLVGNRATVMTARNDAAGLPLASGPAATATARGSTANVQGNTLDARGRAPAVLVVVETEGVLGNNRISHRGGRGQAAVQVNAPVALLSANRVRSGDLAVAVTGGKSLVALGNITSGAVRFNGAPLPAPWAALNINA